MQSLGGGGGSSAGRAVRAELCSQKPLVTVRRNGFDFDYTWSWPPAELRC